MWSLCPREHYGLWCWKCTLSCSVWRSEELWEGTVADWKVILGTEQHQASQHNQTADAGLQNPFWRSGTEVTIACTHCSSMMWCGTLHISTAQCCLGLFSTPEPHGSSICESCLQQLPRWPGARYHCHTGCSSISFRKSKSNQTNFHTNPSCISVLVLARIVLLFFPVADRVLCFQFGG